MASCRLIVNSALRKLGRLAAGREPRAADAADALAALQGLYGSWVAAGAFGRLNDVLVSTDYAARPNDHVVRDGDAASVVTLPRFAGSCAQRHVFGLESPVLDGDGYAVFDDAGGVIDASIFLDADRPRDPSPVFPRNAVIRISDDNATETYLYETATKRWQLVSRLQQDNEAPRSSADPEGLAAALALELADMFGAEVGLATQRQAARFMVAMTHGYDGRRETACGVYV